MEERVATLIIEPRSLVREALVSLMTKHSYRVVGGVASRVDIDSSLPVADVPKLVILGALPAGEIAAAASCIRKMWSGTKIILLFECASSGDLQKLLASEIDGCIPFSVSPATLVGSLQQIVGANLRMLVLGTATGSLMPSPPDGGDESGEELELDTNALERLPAATDVTHGEAHAVDRSFSVRVRHGLSEREDQIIRSVVKGHSNKIIARTCGIADATIKVHMKSIMRKIRVMNRTQAAIWALENGYSADGLSA
jgi:two-component system nitrate/nitrite response regulator NarL